MNDKKENLLQYLFNKTTPHEFVTLYELEVEFGLSGWELRSYLEDLKADRKAIATKEDGTPELDDKGKPVFKSDTASEEEDGKETVKVL